MNYSLEQIMQVKRRERLVWMNQFSQVTSKLFISFYMNLNNLSLSLSLIYLFNNTHKHTHVVYNNMKFLKDIRTNKSKKVENQLRLESRLSMYKLKMHKELIPDFSNYGGR